MKTEVTGSNHKIVGWFTVAGVHVPLYKGENKNEKIKKLQFDKATKARNSNKKKMKKKQNAKLKKALPKIKKELKTEKDAKRREFLKATQARYKNKLKSK